MAVGGVAFLTRGGTSPHAARLTLRHFPPEDSFDMKRILLTAVLVAALPLAAQQAASNANNLIVATVNGESITQAKLDQLWNRLSEKMRKQYEKAGGGKAGFLDNYIRKRLLLQQAVANGFEKRPDVQAELEAAKESALFDLYVRDVIGATVVTDEEMHKFYDEHQADFSTPERVKLRQILVKTENRSTEAAREQIGNVMSGLFAARTQIAATGGDEKEKFSAAFAQAAAKYSEDASAAAGGDLGWVSRDMLDPKLADAAFRVRPGMMSGVLESSMGVHLILVEDHQAASTESFESARPAIREYLLGRNAQKVLEEVNKTTQAIRTTSKVEVYPENIR
jgi:peptidyl-prolyl cis-trans isomerase C